MACWHSEHCVLSFKGLHSVCLTVFFEGIKLLSTYMDWLNAETLERALLLPTHGQSFMRLWYKYGATVRHVFPDLSLQMYE